MYICTYANRLSSTYLSRFLLDVLGLLLGVGRLRTEAEHLGGDTVAGADAAVCVRKGVVAEADRGDRRRAGGRGRRRCGNEAAELQAALRARRRVLAAAHVPDCARPPTASTYEGSSVAKKIGDIISHFHFIMLKSKSF